jgi:hypothetical protein
MQQLVTANLYTSANIHGTSHIQRALETATTEEIIMVYEEVIPFARTLTTDVFANYAAQTTLNICVFLHVFPRHAAFTTSSLGRQNGSSYGFSV